MKKFVVVFLIVAVGATIGLLIASGKGNLLFNNLIGFLVAILLAILLVLGIVTLVKWLRTPKEEQKKGRGFSAAGVIATIVLIVFAVVTYNLISSYTYPKAPQTRVVAEIPKCAGDYDFSHIELPASGEEMRKITVNFRPDCRTEVSLPPCANYRTRPTTDYEIRFIDGAKFIGGPGKQTWFGVHRGLFAVQGLTQAGTLEIFLEKK